MTSPTEPSGETTQHGMLENHFKLILYVTGASPNSIKAISNLKAICELHLAGRYSLDIVDVYKHASIAVDEQIIALPMLIRKYPLPESRLIGDMSNTGKVLRGLGILD